MMLNIVESFLNNIYFWLGNQKKRFGLSTQPLPCCLKQCQNKRLCTLSFKKLASKDTTIRF